MSQTQTQRHRHRDSDTETQTHRHLVCIIKVLLKGVDTEQRLIRFRFSIVSQELVCKLLYFQRVAEKEKEKVSVCICMCVSLIRSRFGIVCVKNWYASVFTCSESLVCVCQCGCVRMCVTHTCKYIHVYISLSLSLPLSLFFSLSQFLAL